MSTQNENQAVDDFVSVKAPKNPRVQQRSTGGMQQVQYQSPKNNKFLQNSISV